MEDGKGEKWDVDEREERAVDAEVVVKKDPREPEDAEEIDEGDRLNKPTRPLRLIS
jgi:hypothetical protein